MTGATIRPACAEDVAALAALKRATFRQAFVDGGFHIPYPADDLAGFERASYSVEAVATELADPQRMQWVAEADGRFIGYAHVGPAKLPHPDVSAGDGELYQLYLDDAAQGLGLGRQLLDIALDHLAAARPGPIWIGVWSGNHRAQAIYAKRGFVKVGDYRFPVGEWHDDEFILRHEGAARD
ncbi:GNAT family N-acetyltransferase [Sphingomonas nostoxanthinifaciens]|uniref:GNAT family N-acetyltransferase n=1 Tax=Sphingomonas nostoxanthinifaciens TaxID=2872652 RepID=UPI001CC21A6B|nr:GNAT family N-acetyltransferase [Sphingomonas nostoxanthinifaciens]UAK24219.1 GNAT family N-acetyltransferase [Sphingomonas nostoxanthinifaciens]